MSQKVNAEICFSREVSTFEIGDELKNSEVLEYPCCGDDISSAALDGVDKYLSLLEALEWCWSVLRLKMCSSLEGLRDVSVDDPLKSDVERL